MRDVARRAGVSVKTVSNVVNDFPHVSGPTRARVLAAIAELGYRMNFSARNLSRGRTGMITLAVPDLRLPYFAELAAAVMTAADERGYTSFLHEAGLYSREQADRIVAKASCDGQLVRTRVDPVTGKEHKFLDEVAIPAPAALV